MRSSKILIECSVVIFILLLFEALQYNAISRGNYAGQDFWAHCNIIMSSAHFPWQALRVRCGGDTPSTLYHFIAGRIVDLFGESKALDVIATVNCISNMVALFLFYLLIRKTIGSLLMRFSCFLFIVFLPITVITSVVISSDAFIAILFVSIVWVVILSIQRLAQKRNCLGLMAAGGMLLVIAFATKFILGLCMLGILLVGAILGWCHILDKKQLWSGFIMLFLLPLVMGIFCYFAFIRFQTIYIGPRIAGQSMSFQSLILLKDEDRQLLDAPYIHEMKFRDGKSFQPLDQNNYYSYPAMMHLSIFTDFLNIYQPIRLQSLVKGMEDEYSNRIRSPENQDRMRLAVRSGLLFSFAAFIAVSWLVLKTAYSVCTRKMKLEYIYVLVPLILSLTVFLGMALGLPFTFETYHRGTWLPRHVMPIILSYGMLMFVVLENVMVNKLAWVRWVILGTVILQSFLHISFLWVLS